MGPAGLKRIDWTNETRRGMSLRFRRRPRAVVGWGRRASSPKASYLPGPTTAQRGLFLGGVVESGVVRYGLLAADKETFRPQFCSIDTGYLFAVHCAG